MFIYLPPTRPVCDSRNGPIARSSNLLSLIFKPLMEERKFVEGCDSTEDMLAAVREANKALDKDPKLKDGLTLP